MNVPSRKSNNPSFKRDPNAIHFTSHPQSPGNLHDGMSYPGSNPISLQPSAAPVTVQAANAPLSQHTSPYLQNNSVPLAHPSTYHHLAAHVPVSSTQTIQIQTHSQGPTPSSTPPTVPNDSKGSHPYPQHNYPAMNPFPVRPPLQNTYNMNNSRNPGGRAISVTPRPQLFLVNGSPYYFPQMQPIPGLASQMNGGNLMPSQYPIASSTSPEPHSIYYSSLPPASSTPQYNHSYSANRPPWAGQNRTAPQSSVQMPSQSNMIPNNAYISSVPIAPQPTQPPQPQPPQQPTQLQLKTKKRPNAVPIINPETSQEVIVNDDNEANDEQSAKSKETMEAENRKRMNFSTKIKEAAQEPSSRAIPSAQSSTSSSTILKESTTSGSMNGASSPVVTIAQPITIVAPPSTGDRKSTPQPISSTTNNVSGSTISDSNVSSDEMNAAAATATVFKPPATLPAALSSSTKMDYKRPTREEPLSHQQKAAAPMESTAAVPTVVSPVTVEGSKLRQSAPAWPEMPSTLSKVVSNVAATGANLKLAKESEICVSVSSSTLGSSFSSVATAPASSVAPIPTVAGQDAVHKISPVTTSSSVVVDDSACTVSSSKGVPPSKQGIQNASSPSGVSVSQSVDEVSPVSKTTASAKPAVSTSSVPLLPQPSSVPAATPSSASTVLGKSKQKGGVPSTRDPVLPTPNVAAAGSSDATSASIPAAAISSVVSTGKSPASSGAQPPATSVASQAPGAKSVTPTLSQSSAHSEDDRKVTVKEEKAMPPPKQGRRNKEATANDGANAADHQASSGAKNKSAQSASKHHAADGSKSTSSNSQSAAANKQSNGESAESSTEVKMSNTKKKNKNKKEGNKKTSDKDNVDADASVDKAPPLTEKNRGGSSEKASQQQQQPSQNASENATNSSSNANSRKTNSSHKSATVTATSTSNEPKENANIVADSKEKLPVQQIQPNIPAVPKQPATQAHSSYKTESVTIEEPPRGKRRYTVEEILSYRDLPQCKQQIKLKPDVPLMVEARSLGQSRSMSQNGYSAANSFMPAFAHQHPHQAPPRMSMGSGRKSQQGMRRDGRPPQQIHVSLSLKDDVPLRQSKDAWKPTRLNQDKTPDDETQKTEALNKAVRGILNKLTPEKFPTLIEKINTLPIDNSSRLEGVIDLIFQKAIDEPGFCRWYAEMCRVMQQLTVTNEATNSQETFRKILLNKCQTEFQREKAAEMDSEKRLAEIKACNDAEKKKELQLEFEEMERKMRRKSVGNCRFIGELFKLQMLTAKIMIRCIAQLLGNLEEESLECLCKLLTTIGKDLEFKLGASGPMELDKFISQMQDIINDKKNKVSSRIRFMLQDVIDLRRNKWVPRREADNPKTLDQMNQEFERKEQDIKLANMLPRGKQYDDYGRGRDFKKNPKNDKDEWQTVTNKSSFNNKSINQKIDQGKLQQSIRAMAADVTLELGPQRGVSMWRTGAGAGSGSKGFGSNSMHAMQSLSARNSLSSKLTPSNSTEKPRPSGMSREGMTNDSNKMSRSSSSQNSRPISREGSVQRVPPSSRNASQSSTVSSGPPIVDKDVLERYCKTILEEFALNNNLADSIAAFEERVNPQQVPDALECFINIILEKTKLTDMCGRLFAALFKRKLISLSNIVNMLSSLLEFADDILIDCPRLWDYLAETLCPLFIEDCLKYSEFETTFVEKLPKQRNGPFLLAVNDLLNKHGVSKKPSISEYLTKNIDSESFENMKVWINENVGKSQDNRDLVTALTRAVCEYFFSLLNKELNDDQFLKIFNEKFFRYFKFYVENKEDLEMVCLATVADYTREKEFPRGFLLNMCKSLHDSKCVSIDSFLSWKENYKNHHPTCGVVFASLNQFFHSIEE